MSMQRYERRITLDAGDVSTTSDAIQGEWASYGLTQDADVAGPELTGVPGEPTKADARIEYEDSMAPAGIAAAKKPLDDRATT